MHLACCMIINVKYPVYCGSVFETFLRSDVEFTWHVIIWNDRSCAELIYMHL